MKKKEVFIRMAEHLFEQGERAIAADVCLYRSHNGNKCAVGALIDDKYYDLSFEGKSIDDKSVQEAVSNSLGSPLTKDDVDLLAEMQDAHDYEIADDYFKDSCVEALDKIAEKWFNCKLEDLVEV